MSTFAHRFVEFVPEVLENSVLYVSLAYGTVSHRCACGCGREVVTPLTPTDWKLIFDGETVSLYPSIGNWNFPCRSHYWIRNNRVEWAEDWSECQVDGTLARDRALKESYYGANKKVPAVPLDTPAASKKISSKFRPRWWRW